MNIELNEHMVKAARDVREHDCTGSCIYCLNLTSWMGETLARIVAREDQAAERPGP